MVKIRAYNASGELDIELINTQHRDSFTLGTRVLLTCDVTGIPEESEVISYKWYHKCRMGCMLQGIQEGTPYLRAVDDALLVDVTSHDLGGRYYCDVNSGNERIKRGSTAEIQVTG